MMVIGIDLSGPSNTADTSVTVFAGGEAGLTLFDSIEGATDENIFRLIQKFPADQDIIIGLDAPLSYNPGGGDRPSDKMLRQALVSSGMRSGSVMPPTNTRMSYLTLRGISVARLLESAGHPHLRVVEVHPGGALVLGGASVNDVKTFKQDSASRKRLAVWLEKEGLSGVASQVEPSDHFVAACGCALAAWRWAKGNPVWKFEARLPHHPYDFSC